MSFLKLQTLYISVHSYSTGQTKLVNTILSIATGFYYKKLSIIKKLISVDVWIVLVSTFIMNLESEYCYRIKGYSIILLSLFCVYLLTHVDAF